MQNKAKHFLLSSLALLFWLTLWEITARSANIRYIIPTIGDIAIAFGELLSTSDFWLSILLSLIRIVAGFAIGVILATLFAILAKVSLVAHAVISPVMTVARSTPVASFIMVLWLLVGGESIPVLISVLMVMPVVWQSVYDSLNSPDRELNELADVFDFSFSKRIRYVIIPCTVKYALPAIVTASGLAWKAGIAAEIITYTVNSIGREIADAKNYLEGARMFAWTIVVVILSLILETCIKALSRRVNKLWE